MITAVAGAVLAGVSGLSIFTSIPVLGTLLKFFTTPVGRVVGVGLLGLGIYYYGYFKGKDVGYDNAIAEIAAKDDKAIKRAVQAADAVDACYNSPGMRWDTIRGECVRG